MDIQYVLDVYACAVYIVNYISKGQKGISGLLREACSEARKGNLSIRQQVRDIGSKFVNIVEISAQEAVYIVLQLPMRKASRQFILVVKLKRAEPEKHYREPIMLFTSWRNEETDLLQMFSSYQERYKQLSRVIDKQMQQYAVCNEDFNEIQQEMSVVEDTYDYIAPCTQNLEQQDQAEGDEDLHSDFNETYNLSDDLGIPSVDLNTQPLIMNELQDDEYRHMVQPLSN